jgi:hypothetical protein
MNSEYIRTSITILQNQKEFCENNNIDLSKTLRAAISTMETDFQSNIRLRDLEEKTKKLIEAHQKVLEFLAREGLLDKYHNS